MDHEDLDLLNDDEEFDELYEKTVNRTVVETTTRRSVPVQRDLMNNVLPGEVPFYNEVHREVSYGPSHHSFRTEELDYYVYPTNLQKRTYQYDIVRESLLQNVLCAIPTGMGKTFIASTVMLNFFRWTKTAKIIFMAPTRPLVAQQIQACLGITDIPNDETAILLDKSRKNRETIWKEKRVFFATPQVVENDLKRGVLDPKEIICIVIDEAHRGIGSYAYANVVQFIDRFNTSYRVLALTATPGATLENVQEVVDKLNISKIELRTEESADVLRYMKEKHKEKITVGLSMEIEDIIEQLGIAIMPVLKQAIELEIYDHCAPSQINAFVAMQKSQKIITNPSIPEGIKWRDFFILQLLNHMGQMLKRIKIYGIRTFYSYFKNKYNEFTTKYNLGKSTNKIAASFYYHPILRTLRKQCDAYLEDPKFLGHDKLQHIRDELAEFFSEGNATMSRVIIFTELRESALEIVKCVDAMDDHHIRPHIFIGQARAKEGFDDVEFKRKNQPKGRKKVDRLKRQEEDAEIERERQKKKDQEKLERSASRTGSSEDAQINGMTQKQQKDIIHRFKQGEYNVLICTSIGEEGLDIGEVDLIICYDTTSSPIKNIQRMGRTGRKRHGRIMLLFSSNEERKFEKAMEDYSNLQKLIGQNYITYKKSDRILPPEITPRCVEEFIPINEQNEEVSHMGDTDEVIRYATQCMLGKKPKLKEKKKVKKPEPPKSIKRFFMPSNVETGIVPASNLVEKCVIDSTGKKIVVDGKINNVTREPVKEIKTEGTRRIVDLIAEDSISDNDVDLHAIDDANLKKRNVCKPSTTVDKKRKIQQQPTAPSKGEELTAIKSPQSLPRELPVLTPSEREYFETHYRPEASVSIDLVPHLDFATKTGQVGHSSLVSSIISLASRLKNNDRSTVIDMNRTKCIARGLQSGVVKEDNSELSIMDEPNSSASFPNTSVVTGSQLMADKKPLDKTTQAILDQLLDSDSDLEL
ncbi:3'-5' DNA helicase KNAG_0E03530 [Huiozyma naganishii CBS 8797]|uniref:ATP-dependent DNA helicase n=1 Tax=Huiozyma naganishii (strain ATCC MYA-139 / BCRC 22969 / CBS 8797 / KCTC 17520 / NBRC 10181 / NCYC 3082 / Yp74L-3) TaxID=1071383 RepID=J7R6X7_HUIN7|nr:hypothetical protein KNAG_0E03530 [Kazachstania naganishii CBS 8797]CCK70610.1 hypothetical protein KNAG_0E03530 [Kazachstania naganishii CBS 8797]